MHFSTTTIIEQAAIARVYITVLELVAAMGVLLLLAAALNEAWGRITGALGVFRLLDRRDR